MNFVQLQFDWLDILYIHSLNDGDMTEDEPSDEGLFDGVEDKEELLEDIDSETSEQSSGYEQDQETPEWVLMALKQLDGITNLIQTYQKERRQSQNRRLRHREYIVIIASATLLLLIGASAWMTIENALSGDAFTFVLGTLFGALITFLQNMLSTDTVGV